MDALSPADLLLAKFDLTGEDLLAELPDLDEDNVVMLVGSVSDGHATPLSDIDMMVAGSRKPDGDLVLWESGRQRAIRRLESGHEINLEYWEWARLEEIASKFAESARTMKDPGSTDNVVVFDDEEARIIHYILSGIVLSGSSTIHADIFDRDVFLDYLVMYCATRYLATAEDSVGQVMEGDALCASFDLRRAFEFLAGAELASIGHTNPSPRWRAKLLQKVRSDLGDDVFETYMSCLFCRPDMSSDQIEAALLFGQNRLATIFMRRPALLAAAGTLGERMKFVTTLPS
jgi:predicted nucleotidyltransferase